MSVLGAENQISRALEHTLQDHVQSVAEDPVRNVQQPADGLADNQVGQSNPSGFSADLLDPLIDLIGQDWQVRKKLSV